MIPSGITTLPLRREKIGRGRIPQQFFTALTGYTKSTLRFDFEGNIKGKY